MVQGIKPITVLGPGLKHLTSLLVDTLGLKGDDVSQLSKITEIREIANKNIGDSGYRFYEEDGRNILLVEQSKGVAKKVREELKDNFIEDKQDQIIDPTFSEEEYVTSQVLDKVDDILQRAFGRRTSSSSWALNFILKRMGIIEDGEDITAISQILKDPTYVKQYAKYFHQSESDVYSAEEKMSEALGDDPLKEKKLKLSRLTSTILKWCNKIPEPLVTMIPVGFAIQNLAMPILANLVSEGKLGKFFDFMRVINPWIGDFIAEPIGLFKTEILASQRGIKRLNSTDTTENKSITVTDLIGVTTLEEEEFRLQRMVRKVSDAFERLFGKGTTLSSWIIIGLLKLRSPSQNIGALYREFATKYVEDPDFIKKLHAHYQEVNKQSKAKGDSINSIEENKLLAQRFNNNKEQWLVARIVSFFTSIAKNMPKTLMENVTEKFGMFYCAQYLTMPIITKLVGKKTFLGRILGLVRDINPYINDLVFDPIATFQTEIRSIKKESENVPNLIPETKISTPKAIKRVIDYAQNLYKTIRNFGGKIAGEPA